MCGRYARGKDKATLVEEFAVEDPPAEELAADYNVAPTKKIYIVCQRPADEGHAAPGRTLEVARWGLIPSWAKDPSIGSRLINARVETADSKPAFRRAFARRRCLIPADGFYEWYAPPESSSLTTRSGRARKQPFFIHAPGDRSLALAGLFEFWRDPAAVDQPDPWLMTVTILTTTATDAVGRIHDRMPLPLPPEYWTAWLNPEASGESAAEVLREHTADRLEAYPVSFAVNNVRNNGPELMVPIPLDRVE